MLRFPQAQLFLPSSSSLTVLASLSASSFSFFSSSLECFSSALAPAPILLFPAWDPCAQKPSVRKKKKKMKVGLFGGRLLSDRWPHLCSWSINCPQPTLDNVWVFSNLRRGFWASSAHLTEENQWRARTGVFRAELKMRGDADIHHCRSGLTFGGLCCLSGRWTSAQVLITLRCSEVPLKEKHAKQHNMECLSALYSWELKSLKWS